MTTVVVDETLATVVVDESPVTVVSDDRQVIATVADDGTAVTVVDEQVVVESDDGPTVVVERDETIPVIVDGPIPLSTLDAYFLRLDAANMPVSGLLGVTDDLIVTRGADQNYRVSNLAVADPPLGRDYYVAGSITTFWAVNHPVDGWVTTLVLDNSAYDPIYIPEIGGLDETIGDLNVWGVESAPGSGVYITVVSNDSFANAKPVVDAAIGGGVDIQRELTWEPGFTSFSTFYRTDPTITVAAPSANVAFPDPPYVVPYGLLWTDRDTDEVVIRDGDLAVGNLSTGIPVQGKDIEVRTSTARTSGVYAGLNFFIVADPPSAASGVVVGFHGGVHSQGAQDQAALVAGFVQARTAGLGAHTSVSAIQATTVVAPSGAGGTRTIEDLRHVHCTTGDESGGADGRVVTNYYAFEGPDLTAKSPLDVFATYWGIRMPDSSAEAAVSWAAYLEDDVFLGRVIDGTASSSVWKVRRSEAAAEPALVDDETRFWWDTALSELWLVHRRGGVQRKVQLT